MCIKLKEPYVAKTVWSGVNRKNQKWLSIAVDGIDKINLFVDNDVEILEGEMFTVTKINSINYKLVKKGEHYFHNYSANCEIAKLGYSANLDDDFDELSADDLSKVMK